MSWAIRLPSVLTASAPSRDWTAATWGRVIAAYGRWVARSGRVVFESELPADGVIAVGWHSTNLIIMGVHAELRPRPYWAFVPPGALGAVMRGCLRGYDMQAVSLPRDGRGNPAAGLKEMARALKEGVAVGIAVDGPHGPERVLRPGALWLARLSGRPLVVMGAAARPAFRARWWDHHLIPSPHARIAVVYGEPIMIDRGAEIDEALIARVTMALQEAEARAWTLLKSPPPPRTRTGPVRV